MMIQSKRIVLIPAYCPDKKLIDLASILHEMDFSIVVVKDGSKAEHTAIFEAVGRYATVLAHEKKQGKGCRAENRT